MRAQRQMQETVVVNDFLADRHRRQAHVGLTRDDARRRGAAIDGKQRQIVIAIADPAKCLGCP